MAPYSGLPVYRDVHRLILLLFEHFRRTLKQAASWTTKRVAPGETLHLMVR